MTTETESDRFSVELRVYCKNAAVCRRSFHPDAVYWVPSYQRAGVCLNCDIHIGCALDIAEASDEECPVCYDPMPLGVKWNHECRHRFCPACFIQMMWGIPRPTYETYECPGNDAGAWGGNCYLHDDGRRVYEFPEGTFVLSADGGQPVRQPDAPEDETDEPEDDDEEVGMRESCPICVRTRSTRATP